MLEFPLHGIAFVSCGSVENRERVAKLRERDKGGGGEATKRTGRGGGEGEQQKQRVRGGERGATKTRVACPPLS